MTSMNHYLQTIIMSAAGTYGFFPKIQLQDKQLLQMTSGGYQKPFFLGGSQIPTELNLDHHHINRSANKQQKSHITKSKDLSVSGKTGRGIKTTASKYNSIYLPKYMAMIHK